MKKYFTTIAMAMVMMVVFAMPAYGCEDCESSEGDNGNHYGWYKNKYRSGNGPIKQQQGQLQGQHQGQVQGQHQSNENVNSADNSNYGNTQETIVQGDTITNGDQIVQGDTITDGDQTVIIENPDELKVNSQLNPMAGAAVDNIEYHGPVYEDHKFQSKILNFVLQSNYLKPFAVKEHGFFTRDSAESCSKDISVKEHDETTVVYVFRDMEDLKNHVGNYETVGYADTYSDGDETLMDCFDQAVIDSGVMGGNILVFLKVDYIAALASKTVGLGGSGAAGFMNGVDTSRVFGTVIGYASSKATPETDPFIHGMILYSPELPAENE